MTLLADLAATSNRVAQTASRNAKTAELAAFLRQLAPHEIEIAVAYLSGETRQGKTGIGYASMRDAEAADPPDHATITLQEFDETLARIAATSGSGSKAL